MLEDPGLESKRVEDGDFSTLQKDPLWACPTASTDCRRLTGLRSIRLEGPFEAP